MNAQQLKNSILQMAVQGKLVPQDPNDEPASVLLERIRKEKEQLIKEGKIKKEKNPSYIFRGADNMPYEKIGNAEPVSIADEVLFEIPKGWEWVRISSISIVVTKGTTPRGGNVVYLDEGIGFLRAENVAGFDRIDKSNLNYIDEITHIGFLRRSILEANDILITIAGTLGRTALVRLEDLPLNANQAVSIIRPVNSEYLDLLYIVIALNSPIIQKRLTTQKRITAIPNLTLEIISDCLIPIPPLEEQRRIVNTYAKFVPLLEAYDQMYQLLDDLNSSFPEQLTKSILQEAIKGKLVSQNPNDEPASVLLDRIRAEKERLIKEGKIKRDKNESVIYRRDNSHYEKRGFVEQCIESEIPFDIPENWTWVRINNVIDVRDGTHDTPKYVTDGIPLITSKNLTKDTINYSTAKNISYEDAAIINQRSRVDDGDILFAMIGTIGNPVFVKKEREFCIKNMALFKQINPTLFDMRYLLLYLKLVQAEMKKTASASVQSFVSLTILRNYLLPLPPLCEQKRIVDKCEVLLSFTERLPS